MTDYRLADGELADGERAQTREAYIQMVFCQPFDGLLGKTKGRWVGTSKISKNTVET